MRKVKVKRLRKEFEESSYFLLLKGQDKLRTSSAYKTEWRLFKKTHRYE
jgi:hypothetical protein